MINTDPMTSTRVEASYFIAPICAICMFVEHASAQCTPQEVAKIVALDGALYDLFARSISIDRDTLVVGSPFDDDNGPNSGSAYVFERDRRGSGNWGQVAKLVPSDGASMDQFGYSVSIGSDTLIVGAGADDDLGDGSGSAYVFARNQGGLNKWGQVAKLLASDGSELCYFGISVSLSGATCFVGAFRGEQHGVDTGVAYVFDRNQGGTNNWGQVTKLAAPDTIWGDDFGASVALSGSTAVIGSTGQDELGDQAGAAYVFERDANGPNSWGQVAKLLASDGSAGDQFGIVAISDDTVLVGALTDDQNGQYAGSAYIFERDHGGVGNWRQVVKVLPSDGSFHDQFGTFLSLSNDMAVVGAPLDDSKGVAAGSTYVFYRDMGGPNQWGQIAKIYPHDPIDFDFFGTPSISGETIVVGAPKYQLPGAVYVFDNRIPYPPTTYCDARPSSLPDCVPGIQGIGVASATAWSGFTIQTRNVPGKSLGVFVYTHGGAAQLTSGPPGGLCISSSELFVAGPVVSGGTQGECDGLLAFDWNWHAYYVALSDPLSTQAGTSVDGQFWYRDPHDDGSANLTDAITFVVCR